jgi:hypothetical protein
MSLFWLAYRNGKVPHVIILESTSLTMARLRAESDTPGINAHFREGRELDDRLASRVPTAAIGLMMDIATAQSLLDEIEAKAEKSPSPPS